MLFFHSILILYQGAISLSFLSEGIIVKLLSQVWIFATLWTAEYQASPSFTISWSLLKCMFTELVMLSYRLILCHSLLLLSQSFPAPGAFPMIWLCIRYPKYWSFSFSISPSHEYTGLISFRIDKLDLLAVERMLKSLLQTYNLIDIFLCVPFPPCSLHLLWVLFSVCFFWSLSFMIEVFHKYLVIPGCPSILKSDSLQS